MLVNDKRVLAHIEEIVDIKPIVGADHIEVAQVLGWKVIIKKDEFKVGDKVVYIEIDSRVPSDNKYFAFLADRKYKVKTIKLRGQISQGLIVPLDVLPRAKYEIGTDVTDILGIKKIEEEKPKKEINSKDLRLRQTHKKLFKQKWFKYMMKYTWFRELAYRILLPKKTAKGFPTCYEGVHITDQERVENMPWVLENKKPFIVTTKIDGASETVILDRSKKKEEFLVLSRRVRQLDRNAKNYHSIEGDDNVYWQAVDKYHIYDFLSAMLERFNVSWAAIQGEVAGISNGGAKLQGDPHKFSELRFFGYDLILPEIGKMDVIEAAALCKEYGIEWVPIIDTNYILPDDLEEFKKAATGPCEAPGASGLREGYVYRLKENCSFSFKNISREYLLKNDSYY